MKKIEAINYFIKDAGFRFNFLAKYGFLNWVNDEKYLKKMFFYSFGYELNLDNPKTFNEKLQWLKLYDRKPIYSTMVDKYKAKKYVASIIGDEYIIPTLGVWDKAEDIDFDTLPDQFVLKTTHDSHGVIICRNKAKLDTEQARKKLTAALRSNYYKRFREWPYKNVKPRIIAEKYMEDTSASEHREYKFFCFGGQARCLKVDFDRIKAHKENYFSVEGKEIRISEQACFPDFSNAIELPDTIPLMDVLIASIASSDPFLRADFYDVDGKAYFGELTFFLGSALGKFTFVGNDKLFGSWIKLPETIGGYSLITDDIIVVLKKKDKELVDYKVHCFNGVPKVILVCQNRFSHLGLSEDFYNTKWEHLDLRRPKNRQAENSPDEPLKLKEMLSLARKLSKSMPFVRIDFYTVNHQLFFGEMTFYPASGFERFEPEPYDRLFGDWIVLPIEERGNT